jgi:ABC-type multidrug transport system ATPase subunit
MSDVLLTLQDAGRVYGGRVVLQDVSLSLARGEAVAVLGKNGSGKSTLLRLIGGVSALSQGRRIVHRAEGRLTVGYAPERFPQLRMTGWEYLHHMGAIGGLPRHRITDRVTEWLDKFELDPDQARRPCRQYSKGMLQKINLIQALLHHPELLLLDEPLSGLDAGAQDRFIRVLAELKQEGVAIVLTSHEKELAERIADRFVSIVNFRMAEVRRGEVRRGEDRRGDRGSSPRGDKIIHCVLPLNMKTDDWMIRQGVRFSRKSGNGYICRIDGSNSDRFLKAVLEIGGHIESVSEDAPSPPSAANAGAGGTPG